jgi:streptogramin lyase
VWVAEWETGQLHRIDAATGRRTLSVPIGGSRTGPHAVAVTPDAIWVMVFAAEQVWKIDQFSGKVLARIDAPFDFEGAIASRGDSVWVLCCQHDHTVDVLRIDATRATVAKRFSVTTRDDIPTVIGAGRAGVWIRDSATMRRVDEPGGVSKPVAIPAAYQDLQTMAVGETGVWLAGERNLGKYDVATRAFIDYASLAIGGRQASAYTAFSGTVWTASATTVLEADEKSGRVLHEYSTDRLVQLGAGAAGVWGLTNDSLVRIRTGALAQTSR